MVVAINLKLKIISNPLYEYNFGHNAIRKNKTIYAITLNKQLIEKISDAKALNSLSLFLIRAPSLIAYAPPAEAEKINKYSIIEAANEYLP